jgi:TolB protein
MTPLRGLWIATLLVAGALPREGQAQVVLSPFTSGANTYGDNFPTWAPSGNRIAYQSGDLSPAYPSLFYKDIGPGMTEQLYSEMGGPASNFLHPSYSPDGQSVVYARLDGAWYHLYVRPAAGGAETAVTTGTAGPNLSGFYGDMCPTWSPDGQWVLFTSSRGSTDMGYVDLWRVLPNATGLQRITDDNSPFDFLWATWQPGSSTVVYSRQSELLSLTISSGGISNPTQIGLDGNHPSFSPDGRWLAYDRGGDLYLADYASSAETPITSGAALDEAPCWSPNGARIAYSSLVAGQRAIWLADNLAVPTRPSTLGRVKAEYR